MSFIRGLKNTINTGFHQIRKVSSCNYNESFTTTLSVCALIGFFLTSYTTLETTHEWNKELNNKLIKLESDIKSDNKSINSELKNINLKLSRMEIYVRK